MITHDAAAAGGRVGSTLSAKMTDFYQRLSAAAVFLSLSLSLSLSLLSSIAPFPAVSEMSTAAVKLRNRFSS